MNDPAIVTFKIKPVLITPDMITGNSNIYKDPAIVEIKSKVKSTLEPNIESKVTTEINKTEEQPNYYLQLRKKIELLNN